MDVFQTSLSGVVLILAIVVIRTLALYRLPKTVFPALWAAAALRLFVPIRVPSRWSVFTLAARLFDGSTGAAQTAVAPAVTSAAAVTDVTAARAQTANSPSVWTFIWLAGACITAAVFLVSYIRCRRSFRLSRPVENDTVERLIRASGLRRPVRVRCCAGAVTPLTYGILCPTILLPEAADCTDTEQLTCIVAHECVHIRRFDGLLKLLLTAAACVHWFNPMAWVMLALANRDIEMSCDEAVVRTLGHDMKAAYALALISMEESKRALPPIINHFNENAIEERIIAIMKIKQKSALSVILALIIVLGTVTVFATSASAADAEPAASGATVEDDAAMTSTAIARLAEGHPKIAEWIQDCYPDAVWWTYEGYKAAADQYLQGLKDYLGEMIGYDRDGNPLVVTEEWIEEDTTYTEDTLQKLQDGIMISKSIDGDKDCYTEIDPVYIESIGSQEYECSVGLPDGTEKHFGPYDTLEEFRAEAEPFCRKQYEAGNLSQEDMDELAAFFSGQYGG